MSVAPPSQLSRGGSSRCRGARSRRSKRSRMRLSRSAPCAKANSSREPWDPRRASSSRSRARCARVRRLSARGFDVRPRKRTLGLQIDFAPLKITAACPPTGCEENAILFAPGYERSVRSAWGRLYGEAGFLLAGVYSQGSDRGIAQGAHGGLGVDLYSGRVMWNLSSRLLWLQRNSGENVFGVQVGVSVSPRLGGNGRE